MAAINLLILFFSIQHKFRLFIEEIAIIIPTLNHISINTHLNKNLS